MNVFLHNLQKVCVQCVCVGVGVGGHIYYHVVRVGFAENGFEKWAFGFRIDDNS